MLKEPDSPEQRNEPRFLCTNPGEEADERERWEQVLDILKKRPQEFRQKVPIEFIETLVFEGWIRTADRLFTDNKQPIDSLIFHVFNFYFENTRYEFKVGDNKRCLKFPQDRHYAAYLNPANLSKCWFAGEERTVYLWEPDEDDE